MGPMALEGTARVPTSLHAKSGMKRHITAPPKFRACPRRNRSIVRVRQKKHSASVPAETLGEKYLPQTLTPKPLNPASTVLLGRQFLCLYDLETHSRKLQTNSVERTGLEAKTPGRPSAEKQLLS